ncbi:MAG: 23S rRNA (adenine(2503)-C(2))-methyltransferase RlmN [Deltaproteobacteria bacterium]|nr:23S rRNA (adenine(2503)-C(2))-methyltransferase RlmN [Deltaproteobacteria bacterium]MBI3294664.1 23S rRNA (adenine(2503)-C(2))-methyltransferase RlmN [Deltaproteobacteria bacterium]
MRTIIKGMPIPELEGVIQGLGHSGYRAKQLFRWVHQKKINNFQDMSDLSKAFRTECDTRFELPQLAVHEQHESSDGTIKYVIRLSDDKKVEAVYIPAEDRQTLCISTQVGCKMACAFCATGYQKFSRDLKSWEIVDQLFVVNTPKPITNIVLMGMGEPFDNYDEVMRALQIFSHPFGPQIGKRHITVSTVGISDKIEAFIKADIAKLAISLHGTTDEQRSKIMPINKKYPLTELMDLCRSLTMKRGLRVTFEYVLLKDLNDSDEDARRLVKLVRDIPCKLNLLAYNENPFIDIKRPAEERVLAFQKILLEAHLTTTYRRSRGRDIGAACGQLTTKKADKPALPSPL